MPDLLPLQFLLATFAGWVSRLQAEIIAFQAEELRILRKQLGNKRLRLTDDQRRRLAVKGHALGRTVLSQVATIVTPDTILRWYHKLVAMKWTFPGKRVGRPGLMKEIRKLIVRMATDNSSWGYSRIQGELKKLNHTVARSTIAKTLKDNGIPPSTGRATTWSQFLKTHADVICATDFFTTEVWTARGLVTHYVLFVIDHATRKVHIAGITPHPNSAFMAQVARNLTDHIDGFLRGKRHLILGRVESWRGDRRVGGVAVVRRLSPIAGASVPSVIPFPAPATSNGASGFPAHRSPARFVSRLMGPIGLGALSSMASDSGCCSR